MARKKAEPVGAVKPWPSIGRPWTQWDFEGGAPPDLEPLRVRERVAAQESAELLREIVAGAVVRGRCVWCSHRDDPADGRHTETCAIARAQNLVNAIEGAKA